MSLVSNLPPELPSPLRPYHAALQATVVPYWQLEADPSAALDPQQSQAGGQPYWPASEAWPVDKDGQLLQFLLQVNLAENVALPDFPTDGLLQWFVGDGEVSGLNFDAPSESVTRVVYRPATSQLIATPLACPPPIAYPMVPKPMRLKVTVGQMCMTPADKDFNALLGDQPYTLFDDDTAEWLNEELSMGGHRLGGYPHFTQDDARHAIEGEWRLLLQLDTDNALDCMWGDSGVGNVFIRPEDLKALDFSKVFYSWDCC